jgi:hypothetical protein
MATYTLKESVTATSEYKSGACHVVYGKVVISATPSASFTFRSEAIWPAESCEESIRRGVQDVLTSKGLDSDFGAEFVLNEIDWHEVNSCEAGYYNAAKQATEEILKKGYIAQFI